MDTKTDGRAKTKVGTDGTTKPVGLSRDKVTRTGTDKHDIL